MKAVSIFLFVFGLLCACNSNPGLITPAPNAPLDEHARYFLFIEREGELSQAEAVKRAEEDFAAGKYYLIEYGETIGTMQQFERNFDSAFRRFNVHFTLGGCVVNSAGRAYSDRMQELLQAGGMDINALFNVAFYDPHREAQLLQHKADSTRLADSLTALYSK